MKISLKTFTNIVSNVLIFITISFIIFNNILINNSVLTASTKPYYSGCEQEPKVSLMFNVYWGTEYLDNILEILEDNNVKATFFIGGVWAARNQDMLNQIVLKGHEIASHGYYHKDMGKLSYEECKKEIINTNRLLTELTGKEISLFAPPSGSFNNNLLLACEEQNMKVIMWTHDTIDWRDKNANLIFDRATKNLSAGDLVLMHPTSETAKALPRILKYYYDNGYLETTVSETIGG